MRLASHRTCESFDTRLLQKKQRRGGHSGVDLLTNHRKIRSHSSHYTTHYTLTIFSLHLHHLAQPLLLFNSCNHARLFKNSITSSSIQAVLHQDQRQGRLRLVECTPRSSCKSNSPDCSQLTYIYADTISGCKFTLTLIDRPALTASSSSRPF
jgi:hypothetical protein